MREKANLSFGQIFPEKLHENEENCTGGASPKFVCILTYPRVEARDARSLLGHISISLIYCLEKIL